MQEFFYRLFKQNQIDIIDENWIVFKLKSP